ARSTRRSPFFPAHKLRIRLEGVPAFSNLCSLFEVLNPLEDIALPPGGHPTDADRLRELASFDHTIQRNVAYSDLTQNPRFAHQTVVASDYCLARICLHRFLHLFGSLCRVARCNCCYHLNNRHVRRSRHSAATPITIHRPSRYCVSSRVSECCFV